MRVSYVYHIFVYANPLLMLLLLLLLLSFLYAMCVCILFIFSFSVAFWYTSKTITTLVKQSQSQSNVCFLHWHKYVSKAYNKRQTYAKKLKKRGEKSAWMHAVKRELEEVIESKFWELFDIFIQCDCLLLCRCLLNLVYCVCVCVCACLRSSMLSICYWRPEFKLGLQNIRYTRTWYNLDDDNDGMEWNEIEVKIPKQKTC